MSRLQKTPSVHDQPAGTNRREVLLGAGGLAAVAATLGGQARDREVAPGAQLTGTIDDIGPFEVIEVSVGGNSSTGGGGSGSNSSKVTFDDFEFRKPTDVSSPKLLRLVATGHHVKTATFTYLSRKGTPTITYVLEDVLLTSFSIDENASDRPTETVMLTFSKITFSVDGASTTIDLLKGTVS
jgi:type VI protein secretion system component Hcp